MADIQKELTKKELNRVGNNIKLLRKRRKETLEALAAVLHVSKSYVSQFEHGQKPVGEEYLQLIAKHYDVTVEMLIDKDLTNVLMNEYEGELKIKELLDIRDMILCQFKAINSSIQNDDDFMKGDFFFDRFISDDYLETMVQSCRNYYYASFKNGNILSGASNTLMMLFVEYLRIDFSNEIKYRIINQKLSTKELFLYFKKQIKQLSSAKREFIRKNESIFNECLCALRNDLEGRNIAEYYMCLRYFFVMLENQRSYMENVEIGLIMMKNFALLENPFAIKFMEMFPPENDS